MRITSVIDSIPPCTSCRANGPKSWFALIVYPVEHEEQSANEGIVIVAVDSPCIGFEWTYGMKRSVVHILQRNEKGGMRRDINGHLLIDIDEWVDDRRNGGAGSECLQS